jgi:hypothetical protein
MTTPVTSYVRIIDLAWLESHAERIRDFSPLVLHGLLQTKEYAEAVMRTAGPDDTDDQIRKWITFRMKRQEVLAQWTTRSSSMKRFQRVVGDPALMRDQLAHLLELSHRPNITVRVHPFLVGTLTSPDGGFTLLTMPAPFPVVAQVSTDAGALYAEIPQVVRFEAAYTRLQRAALEVDDSRTFIKTRMEQLA